MFDSLQVYVSVIYMQESRHRVFSIKHSQKRLIRGGTNGLSSYGLYSLNPKMHRVGAFIGHWCDGKARLTSPDRCKIGADNKPVLER
jgi:hypothetical protein